MNQPQQQVIGSVVEFVKDALAPSTRIFISMHETSYWEGETIEGNIVVISVNYPYDAIIRAKFKAYSKGVSPIFNKEVHKVLISELSEIFKGQITERVVNIPFKFTLPQSCPASFDYLRQVDNSISKDLATVHYYIRGSLTVPNRIDRKRRQKINVKERQKIPASPVCAFSTPNYFLGSVGLHAWLDRNTYFPGERIIVRLKISNNMKGKIATNMRIRLVHAIEFLEEHKVYFSQFPYILQVAPPPPFFYGTMWVPFNISSKSELSSQGGGSVVRSIFFLRIDFNEDLPRINLPITIVAPQEMRSIHPISAPNCELPPVTIIRPPFQSPDLATTCNLCDTNIFGLLKLKYHCFHCGKVFCTDCVKTTTTIKKLKYNKPVRVCRNCIRVVEDTGGIKHQTTKQVVEEWSKNPKVTWVPQSSKTAFEWQEVKFSENLDTKCLIAVAAKPR